MILKHFYKCLSELKTNTVVASNEQYNESNSCPEGYKLVNNSCQSDASKQKQKSDDLNKVVENKLNIKKNKYNLNDPALNKCFKKMLGEKKISGSYFFQVQKNLMMKKIHQFLGCQQNPDYAWQESIALGYNTIDNFYDIFDGNKMENCVSNPKPVFTHEITDFSQIKQLKRWGLTPQGYLKGHSYIFFKK